MMSRRCQAAAWLCVYASCPEPVPWSWLPLYSLCLSVSAVSCPLSPLEWPHCTAICSVICAQPNLLDVAGPLWSVCWVNDCGFLTPPYCASQPVWDSDFGLLGAKHQLLFTTARLIKRPPCWSQAALGSSFSSWKRLGFVLRICGQCVWGQGSHSTFG